MKAIGKVVVFFVAFFASAGTSFGFDGERSGFVLGFGVGTCYGRVDLDYDSDYIDGAFKQKISGLATSFRLGWGIGNHFVLHYSGENNFFTFDSDENDSINYVGITGIGATYYIFEEVGHTPYLTAVFGHGIFSGLNDLESSANSKSSGLGYQIGIGYEFSKWMGIQFDYGKSNHVNDEEDEVAIDISYVNMSIQFNFY